MILIELINHLVNFKTTYLFFIYVLNSVAHTIFEESEQNLHGSPINRLICLILLTALAFAFEQKFCEVTFLHSSAKAASHQSQDLLTNNNNNNNNNQQQHLPHTSQQQQHQQIQQLQQRPRQLDIPAVTITTSQQSTQSPNHQFSSFTHTNDFASTCKGSLLSILSVICFELTTTPTPQNILPGISTYNAHTVFLLNSLAFSRSKSYRALLVQLSEVIVVHAYLIISCSLKNYSNTFTSESDFSRFNQITFLLTSAVITITIASYEIISRENNKNASDTCRILSQQEHLNNTHQDHHHHHHLNSMQNSNQQNKQSPQNLLIRQLIASDQNSPNETHSKGKKSNENNRHSAMQQFPNLPRATSFMESLPIQYKGDDLAIEDTNQHLLLYQQLSSKPASTTNEKQGLLMFHSQGDVAIPSARGNQSQIHSSQLPQSNRVASSAQYISTHQSETAPKFGRGMAQSIEKQFRSEQVSLGEEGKSDGDSSAPVTSNCVNLNNQPAQLFGNTQTFGQIMLHSTTTNQMISSNTTIPKNPIIMNPNTLSNLNTAGILYNNGSVQHANNGSKNLSQTSFPYIGGINYSTMSLSSGNGLNGIGGGARPKKVSPILEEEHENPLPGSTTAVLMKKSLQSNDHLVQSTSDQKTSLNLHQIDAGCSPIQSSSPNMNTHRMETIDLHQSQDSSMSESPIISNNNLKQSAAATIGPNQMQSQQLHQHPNNNGNNNNNNNPSNSIQLKNLSKKTSINAPDNSSRNSHSQSMQQFSSQLHVQHQQQTLPPQQPPPLLQQRSSSLIRKTPTLASICQSSSSSSSQLRRTFSKKRKSFFSKTCQEMPLYRSLAPISSAGHTGKSKQRRSLRTPEFNLGDALSKAFFNFFPEGVAFIDMSLGLLYANDSLKKFLIPKNNCSATETTSKLHSEHQSCLSNTLFDLRNEFQVQELSMQQSAKARDFIIKNTVRTDLLLPPLHSSPVTTEHRVGFMNKSKSTNIIKPPTQHDSQLSINNYINNNNNNNNSHNSNTVFHSQMNLRMSQSRKSATSMTQFYTSKRIIEYPTSATAANNNNNNNNSGSKLHNQRESIFKNHFSVDHENIHSIGGIQKHWSEIDIQRKQAVSADLRTEIKSIIRQANLYIAKHPSCSDDCILDKAFTFSTKLAPTPKDPNQTHPTNNSIPNNQPTINLIGQQQQNQPLVFQNQIFLQSQSQSTANQQQSQQQQQQQQPQLGSTSPSKRGNLNQTLISLVGQQQKSSSNGGIASNSITQFNNNQLLNSSIQPIMPLSNSVSANPLIETFNTINSVIKEQTQLSTPPKLKPGLNLQQSSYFHEGAVTEESNHTSIAFGESSPEITVSQAIRRDLPPRMLSQPLQQIDCGDEDDEDDDDEMDQVYYEEYNFNETGIHKESESDYSRRVSSQYPNNNNNINNSYSYNTPHLVDIHRNHAQSQQQQHAQQSLVSPLQQLQRNRNLSGSLIAGEELRGSVSCLSLAGIRRGQLPGQSAVNNNNNYIVPSGNTTTAPVSAGAGTGSGGGGANTANSQSELQLEASKISFSPNLASNPSYHNTSLSCHYNKGSPSVKLRNVEGKARIGSSKAAAAVAAVGSGSGSSQDDSMLQQQQQQQQQRNQYQSQSYQGNLMNQKGSRSKSNSGNTTTNNNSNIKINQQSSGATSNKNNNKNNNNNEWSDDDPDPEHQMNVSSKTREFDITIFTYVLNSSPVVMLLVRDVTHRSYIKLLQDVTKKKSKMVSFVSHELRTPLNSIIAMLETMKNNPHSDYIETALMNSKYLLCISNDLLDLAQIKVNKFHLRKKCFNLKELLMQTMEMFEIQAARQSIELNIDYQENVQLFVYSDKNRIRQVLINLLGNAFKFILEGSITVQVRMLSDALFEVKVIDTGIGIKEGDLNKLFKTFGKLDAEESVKMNEQGVGLGLVISNMIAFSLSEDNEGLTVSSEYGKGTTFQFKLLDWDPLQSEEAERAFEEQEKEDYEDESVNNDYRQIEERENDEDESGSAMSVVKKFKPYSTFEIQSSAFAKSKTNEQKAMLSSMLRIDMSIRGSSTVDFKNPGNVIFERNKVRIQTEMSSHWEAKQKKRQPKSTSENINLNYKILSLSGKQKRIPDLRVSSQQSLSQPATQLNIKEQWGQILIVDDNMSNIMAMQCLIGLINPELKCNYAIRGKAAEELVESRYLQSQTSRWYSIIFMDIVMPEQDGISTSRNIIQFLEAHDVHDTKIVACSGYDDDDEKRNCINAGLTDYLVKPVFKEKLANVIHMYL